MKNLAIRNKAKEKGVHLWQIAEFLEFSETTFCKKLRKELPQEEQEKIVQAINSIASEREERYGK